jgi:hypothetical protein
MTLLAGVLLLLCSACFVSVTPPAPTATPLPSPTETPTIIWFPPTPTFTPYPTVAVSPTANLRNGVGELLLEDDFSDPAAWSTSSDNEASAAVSNGSINLSLKSADDYLLSTRSGPVFGDFYAEITANPNFCHGEDEYGFIVRDLNGDHYRLVLSCDGRVKVDRFYRGLSRQAGWLQSAVIPDVMPSSSRLQIWAAGSQMRFFVNDIYLFSITDNLLYQGTIGVFVHTAGEGDVSVSFSDLKVWAVTK